MTQPTEAPQGASLSDEMRRAALLTTKRNNANDTLLAWISLQRCMEGLAHTYAMFRDEEALVSWLKSGAQAAHERATDLEGIVAGYDERLTILTAKIRQEYLGDMEL